VAWRVSKGLRDLVHNVALGCRRLPQPKDWRDLTVEAETADPGSMLALYRRALAIRRAEPALGDGPMTWQPAADGVLSLARGPGLAGGPGLTCVVNLSAGPAELPAHDGVLLASGPLDAAGGLPPDTAVWLRAGTGTGY
jgi:alpha-glucosidase